MLRPLSPLRNYSDRSYCKVDCINVKLNYVDLLDILSDERQKNR